MGGKGSGRRPALQKSGVPVMHGLDENGLSFFDMMVAEKKLTRTDSVILNMAADTFQQWLGMINLIRVKGTMTRNRFGERIVSPYATRERQLFRDLIAVLRELKATPATREKVMKLAEEAQKKTINLIDTDIGEEL